MTLIIYCEECTRHARLTDKWHIVRFVSLTDAWNHIQQYGHQVHIDIEHDREDDE